MRPYPRDTDACFRTSVLPFGLWTYAKRMPKLRKAKPLYPQRIRTRCDASILAHLSDW